MVTCGILEVFRGNLSINLGMIFWIKSGSNCQKFPISKLSKFPFCKMSNRPIINVIQGKSTFKFWRFVHVWRITLKQLVGLFPCKIVEYFQELSQFIIKLLNTQRLILKLEYKLFLSNRTPQNYQFSRLLADVLNFYKKLGKLLDHITIFSRSQLVQDYLCKFACFQH